jgi:23S rRNA U2552 (ribose-2'-O)-methylase RlmE/FtsJ
MKHLISGGKDNYTIKKGDLYILEYLRNELNSTKSKIDQHYLEWEGVKKIIHDYEYVYYSSYRKKNISSVAPVSRSYFKFREIFYDFNMKIENINTVCNLAEAPGGFIESLIHLSGSKSMNIYANSLLSNDKSIPMWNNKIKRYKIKNLYGIKNNGDICDFHNIISMIKKIGRNACELVTGDGGFDYSPDYSNQENNSLRLIRCEIFLALNIQKVGGNFICKIFDTFHMETIKLLYLLYLSYEKVYLYKPRTSRNSNSEKYIVCLNYKGYNKRIVNLMCHSIKKDKLNIVINKYFYDNLLRFICEYSIKQIKNINKGIHIIEEGVIDNLPTKEQINLAKKWCEEYDIRINDRCLYL